MTYAQFKEKYRTGTNRPDLGPGYWDYDGYYGYQCQDLIGFYSKELGLPHLGGNAADVANLYPAGYLHVSVPQQGDIVVFARNAANGYAGHIAIYDSPGFYFSQNYPTGSNSHTQYINEPIISILRPLGGNIADEQTIREREELRNYSKQSNYKVAQLAHVIYDGLPLEGQPDAINRPWIDTYPVDKIVDGISRGRPPVSGVTKDQVLTYLNQHLT